MRQLPESNHSVNIVSYAVSTFKGCTILKGKSYMTNQQEWNEFLNSLLSNAIAGYRNSKEYGYLKQRQEQIDEMLTTNLTEDEKIFVEEILFELGLAAERETEIVYHQGLRDGIWLLKDLGVLA